MGPDGAVSVCLGASLFYGGAWLQMSVRIDYKRAAPEAVKALGAMKPYILSTDLSPRLRALVELRT